MQNKLRQFLAQQLRKPTENLLILLAIVLLGCLNYLQGNSGRFIFALEILNDVALVVFWSVLFLLLVNSFFFTKIYLKVIGSLFFGLLLLMISLFALLEVYGANTILVKRLYIPGGRYVVSVYETKYDSFPDYGMGPLCICQVYVRQEKILPGILRARGVIHKDDCFCERFN
ncbi:MAG: hypothetical protein EAZ60_21360 [Oscillatoriales cyanobacterium]|nr:MAG: hypothetical protein EAZ83_31595 [Oscillatoriales cyanobacterium]TAF12467.1 MAG: hypothetical protein EAZ73_31765 [Oscillatoriales cyanobacterium]TAF53127.1 MAG: hypothetical protein EAZ60_21360 [Oscillatoriales cyanobacterium]